MGMEPTSGKEKLSFISQQISLDDFTVQSGVSCSVSSTLQRPMLV